MTTPSCRCKYNSKIYLVVDLSKKCGVAPEVLRSRFKAAKSWSRYKGRLIPVLTDYDLRPVGAANAMFSGTRITELNREWLSRPLIRSAENVQ